MSSKLTSLSLVLLTLGRQDADGAGGPRDQGRRQRSEKTRSLCALPNGDIRVVETKGPKPPINQPKDLIMSIVMSLPMPARRAPTRSRFCETSSGRYIFPAPVPPALDKDQASVGGSTSKLAFDFAMMDMKPTKQNAMGTIRMVDSSTFKVSKTVAMAHVTVKAGAMRELHRHPNAAEWQYYIAGQGRMTLFANHSDARTMDFRAGDVGYIAVTLPHYIENTGSGDLVFLEMFKAPHYSDVSLNNWLAAVPPELLRQHLSLAPEILAAIPKANTGIVPLRG